MSYLLRVYTGNMLVEHELELNRSYHAGGSNDEGLMLPGIGISFTIETDGKSWRGNSRDKRYRSALGDGSDQALQTIVVLDAENKIAVTVYQSGPANSHSIDISNEDTTKVVTVIVNEGGSTQSSSSEEMKQSEPEEEKSVDQSVLDAIADKEGSDVITVTYDECPYMTKDILSALHRSKKVLRVKAEEYVIEIHGANIKNAENELSTMLDIYQNNYGLCFVVNEKNSLPGPVKIEFLGLSAEYRYMYLYDEANQKYMKLSSYVNNIAEIQREGEYVFTESAIKTTSFNVYIVVIVSVAVCIAGGTYILIRKRHWFW